MADKREEIERSRNVIAETAKLMLEYRHCNVDLVFDIITSEQITLSTDITDHIVEDHTMIQDHITIKPRVFTMRGLISEKVYNHPDSVEVDIPDEPWKGTLGKLGVLAPIVSSNVFSAINAVEAGLYKIEQGISKVAGGINAGARKILKLLGWKPSANLVHEKWAQDMQQLTAITLLETCRINRIPVKVQTGWGEYLENNYYITDISVTQGDTYQQADLSVTVKEVRFATTETRKMTEEDVNRMQQQSAEANDTVTGSTDTELESKMHAAKYSDYTDEDLEQIG